MKEIIELKEQGNEYFLKKNYQQARLIYQECLEMQKNSPPHIDYVKILSNLILVCQKQLDLKNAIQFGNEAQNYLNILQKDSQYETFKKKIQFRIIQTQILDELQQNYEQSLKLTNKNPTFLSSSFLQNFFDPKLSQFFYINQYKCVDAQKLINLRFLATTNVFNCTTIFAHCQNKAFGAHIHVSAILGGAADEIMGDKTYPLKNISEKMVEIFKEYRKDEVKIHIVGGSQFSDIDETLKLYYKQQKQKHSQSWHVIQAVQIVGFSNINLQMLNQFKGANIGLSLQQEQKLYEDNQKYQIIGLDIDSGYIFTSTANGHINIPFYMQQYEKEAYKVIQDSNFGQPVYECPQ